MPLSPAALATRFAAELTVCHMLARVLKIRCAIVLVGDVVCTLDGGDVEPGMTVLYVTI